MNTTAKPIAKVIGKDGNVFNTLAICTEALKKAGMEDKADELTDKVFNAKSYPAALNFMREYCELR